MSSHGPFSSLHPDCHRIAWYGIALLLPQTWNLALHHGNARTGRLTFANLHRPTLHVRWRTPARLFEPLVTRLSSKPGATLDRLSPAAARIHINNETLLLAHDNRRVYELHWPASQDANATTTTNDFITNLHQPEPSSEWFWSIYGAEGYVPARAVLKRASLLPGATELDFACPGGAALTFGSFSMANRLLAGRSLQDWAKRDVAGIRHFNAGDWQVMAADGGQQAVFRASGHQWRFGLRRRVSHTFVFEHDRLADRIRWTHRLERLILTPAT